MTIRAWTPQDGGIDNTYGYNDMIVTLRDSYNGGRELTVLDNATSEVLAGIGEDDIPNEDRIRQSGMLREGDQLLQYTNGAVILRRTIFTDQCLEGDMARTNNFLPLSEEAARAIAYFTQTDVDISWCLAPRRGVTPTPGETPRLVTPWDLSQKSNLLTLQTALGQIRAARNAGSDPRGRSLAAAVPEQELGRLEAEIQTRIERLDSAGDLFMRHPVLHTLGIAFLFGVGTDIYHLAKYALIGGRPPWEGGHRGFLLRIYDRVRGRGGNDQNPPDDQNPPAASGGGGGPVGETAQVTSPEGAAQMSMMPEAELNYTPAPASWTEPVATVPTEPAVDPAQAELFETLEGVPVAPVRRTAGSPFGGTFSLVNGGMGVHASPVLPFLTVQLPVIVPVEVYTPIPATAVVPR